MSYLLDLSKGFQDQTPQALPTPDDADGRFAAWDWSPDGKKLAVGFNGTRTNGVSWLSLETKRFERLGDYDALSMWLPDSRRFVFAHDGKAFVANTETKKIREMFSHAPEQIRSVAVSRDGKLLYYTLFSSESDIWLLDLE